MKVIFIGSHIFLLIFGLVFIISPMSLLNYFVKKDLEKNSGKENDMYEKALVKNKKICKIGGIYCVIMSAVGFFINNSLITMLLYCVVPIVGLNLMEKRFDKDQKKKCEN